MHENVKFWRAPDLGNLELLRATYITHAFSPHFHEGFAIGVIQHGAQKVDYRGSKHIMPAGTVCVLNPGEMHTGKALDPHHGWTYRMLYPNADLLLQIASQISDRQCDIPFFSHLVIHDDFLVNALLDLHAALESPETSRLERESRLVWTLSQLIIRHADSKHVVRTAPFHSKYVKRVREYLDNCYAENISLEHLAQLVDLSPFHLLRLFKKEVGVTQHVYLTHRRIHVAKLLLLAGYPIARVAYETGFVDQSHLTNRFRKIVGVTPGQYRISV